MKTKLQELTEQAYAAYNIQAGGKTWDGKPLPSFEELGSERQACWYAAIKSIYHKEQPASLDNWRRRALRAEQRLHSMGAMSLNGNYPEPDPTLNYTDDEWLVRVLCHKDVNKTTTIDELNEARSRLGSFQWSS